MPWLLFGLMCAASVAAHFLRPSTKLASEERPISLERMVPKRIGDWRDQPSAIVQVVNPQTQALLDKLYSQLLSRVYVNAQGYRIMLSIAYGTEQRGSLQAHKPEVCYPAQGFTLREDDPGELSTPYGTIPVRRLYATMGLRREPVTYWFTIGNSAVQTKWQERLAKLRYGLTGVIPDGLLFRVSSIDGDPAHAYRVQDEFVNALLRELSPADRRRLSGLGPVDGSIAASGALR